MADATIALASYVPTNTASVLAISISFTSQKQAHCSTQIFLSDMISSDNSHSEFFFLGIFSVCQVHAVLNCAGREVTRAFWGPEDLGYSVLLWSTRRFVAHQ